MHLFTLKKTFKLYNEGIRELSPLSSVQFTSVQLLSCVRLFTAPWIAARQASLSITISGSPLKLTSIELVMPSSHLILCRLLFLLPPIPPSIRVFSNESTLRLRWPKYWSSSFSISPSKEHPGPISFRMDSLIIREMQIKSTVRYYFTPVRMVAIQKPTNNKCWRECRGKVTLLVGMQTSTATMENSVEIP